MAWNSGAWGHDGVTYNGQAMRELVESLTGGLAGVVGPVDALKVTQQSTAAATVRVAEGGVIIPATGAGLGGSYQAWNGASLNSPTIAPTSANGRKDRLIVRVTAGVAALEVVQGTAAASPAEPSITGDNFLELALITLPASTTNITDAMITDRRVRLAAGTPVVCTSTTRPASPYEGMLIYETDTDGFAFYDGSTWKYQFGPIASYTPTNTGITVGDGTQTAKWGYRGGLVHVEYSLVLGSTTAFSGTIQVGLPVAMATNVPVSGSVLMADAATARRWVGGLQYATPGTSVFIVQPGSGNSGLVNVSNPFTWAVGSELSFTFDYRPA